MNRLWIVGCMLVMLVSARPAQAQTSAIKWSFQRTGFRHVGFTPPQTALAMRSGESWPVIFSQYENSLNAYSLFPFLNTQGANHISPATNWHRIGTNLTGSSFFSGPYYFQADSASTDGFAVSLQTPTVSTTPPDYVVLGNSQSGFQSAVAAQAVKFDDAGNAAVATSSLIPNLSPSHKLFDVALSKNGDTAAITQASGGGSTLTYWQRSPLLGNAWFAQPIPTAPDPRLDTLSLFGPSVDLLFDNASRPHMVGINRTSGPNVVSAYRFDITTGAWINSVLDSSSIGSTSIADVAAASNDDGIVGAAWVNNGTLKYGYLDTNLVDPQWIVTNVAATTPTGILLEKAQGVGLAFDNAGLPVISFVDGTSRQIWLAYDPPSVFGGGVTDNPAAEGDFNGDGLVDGYDLDTWQVAFGAEGLTGNDFLAWQRNLSEPVAEAAAIPEPATLSGFLLAAALAAGIARRRTHTGEPVNQT